MLSYTDNSIKFLNATPHPFNILWRFMSIIIMYPQEFLTTNHMSCPLGRLSLTCRHNCVVS